MSFLKGAQGGRMRGVRYYVSFRNPRTGADETLWFQAPAARDRFVDGLRRDFPRTAIRTIQWNGEPEPRLDPDIVRLAAASLASLLVCGLLLSLFQRVELRPWWVGAAPVGAMAQEGTR